MKGLVALFLIVVLVLGGGLGYTYQQSSKQAEWAQSMHAYMGQLADYQAESQNAMRIEAAASLNQTNSQIGELRAAIEGLAHTMSKPAEQAKQRDEAEKEYEDAKEKADDIDTSKLDKDVEDTYNDIKDKTPEDIAKDPEAARKRAKELRDHYDRIVLELRDRNQKRDALLSKLEHLQAIDPPTEEVEAEIEKTKEEIKGLDKEIQRLKEKRDQTKLVLDLFKALLRIAALFSFASGNPAAGMALMQAAGMLEGVGADDGETGGSGGGYPPPPPPPVGGGDGQGDKRDGGGNKDTEPRDEAEGFEPLDGAVANGIQILFKGGGVYARSGNDQPQLLFKAEAGTIDLIKTAEKEKTRVSISAKQIELQKDGVGYLINSDSAGRATVQEIILDDDGGAG